MKFSSLTAFLLTLLIALGVLGLVACSPVAIINGVVSPQRFNAATDLVYGPEPRMRLDVYAPKNASAAPVIVFFHGGSWRNGNKEDYPFLAETLTQEGMLTVIVNYRKAPNAQFPAFMDDAARAIAWVKTNIATHGGNPDNLFVMGHSAGAQIAALVVADPQYLARYKLAPQSVRGLIGVSGPYDFIEFIEGSANLRQVFGDPTNWPKAQPINFANANMPETLLLHGLADPTVSPEQSKRFHARILQMGGRSTLAMFPGIGHEELIGTFSKIIRSTTPEPVASVVAFVRNTAAK